MLSPPPMKYEDRPPQASNSRPHIDLKSETDSVCMTVSECEASGEHLSVCLQRASPLFLRMLQLPQLRQGVIALLIWFAHLMEQQKVQGKVTFILRVQSESLKKVYYAVLKPFLN